MFRLIARKESDIKLVDLVAKRISKYAFLNSPAQR